MACQNFVDFLIGLADQFLCRLDLIRRTVAAGLHDTFDQGFSGVTQIITQRLVTVLLTTPPNRALLCIDRQPAEHRGE